MVTPELLEQRYHVVQLVNVRNHSPQRLHQLVTLTRHLDREHRPQFRVAQEQMRVEVQRHVIAGGGDVRPARLQAGSIHQVEGYPLSTMAGSVAATAAPALPMMSSGTPASFMAPARWPTTALKSSLSIPRPA